MKVSVVIPVLNEAASIESAVQSALDAGAWEVIVVDGGSTDATRELVGRLDCQLLLSNPGRGNQLHYGAQQATGEVLLFLHADNRLGGACINQIATALLRPTAKNRRFGAFQQSIVPPVFICRLLQVGNAARVRLFGLAYGDQAIFVQRQFYFELGGFPAIPLMEDVAFSHAARKVTRPLLLPGPVVVSSRRWQRRGVLRQTISNWMMLLAYRLGISPEFLANIYRKQSGK